MTQLALVFDATPIDTCPICSAPFDRDPAYGCDQEWAHAEEPYQFTPAQASWIDPMRASLLDHPSRVAACPGCELFGLCALHDVTDEDKAAA